MTEVPVFRGLFIGVDNYQHPGFDQLRFAKRDATVLQALFSDTFDGSAKVVLDAAATKDKIVTEMRHLAAEATNSDIVVIAYSGHGTESRELATYDADGDRLAETALPLTEFVKLAQDIKARLLFITLDCCFSGGAWREAADQAAVVHHAKVMWQPESEYTSRTPGDVSDILDRVRGDGRIVLAAAAATQKAYEKAEFGHGVLTYYLIKALLGRSEVLQDGEISMLKMANYVMTSVGWHKAGIDRKSQNPVFEGSVADVRIPILTPGRHSAEVGSTFPHQATSAPSSLSNHGISESFIALWATEKIRRLNDVQLAAINGAGVLRGESVLVNAPTGSGKTLIGELAAIKAKNDGNRTVFLLPSRALVNEQYDQFRRYQPLGIKTIRATGDLRDQLPDLHRDDYDIAILTYEKFTSMVSGDPGLLHRIGVMVVDEIQSLFDPNRGPALEALFTRMKRGRHTVGMPQLVGLSAVLGDPEDLATWLGATLVQSRARAVPLIEGVIGPDGRHRGRKHETDGREEVLETDYQFMESVVESKDDLIVATVTTLVSQEKKVIVFRATREDTRRTAELLADRLRLLPADPVIAELSGGDTGHQHDRLRKCLSGNVAFHIADLSDRQRRVIEQSFRDRDNGIRVLVATTTLAQGVNLPADAVVICDLKHPGDVDYSVSDYKNMAGRAGRPGLGTAGGTAFIVTSGGADADHKLERYVLAEPDAARSALLTSSPDLDTLVLTVLAAVSADFSRGAEEDLRDFLDHSLAAHQARLGHLPTPFPAGLLHKVINDLVDHGFATQTSAGFKLTVLGEIVIRNTLTVSSVRTVAAVLTNVASDALTESTLLCAAQLTEELRDVRFIRKSGRARSTSTTTLTNWLRDSAVAPEVRAALESNTDWDGHGAAAARRTIASVSWIRGIPLAQIESGLITTFAARQGVADPGPVLQAMRRAADVIGAIIDIAGHVHPDADLGELSDLLPGRQELGVVAGHVPIARLIEGDVDRDVFVRLRRAELLDAAAILDSDENEVLACVGNNRDVLNTIRKAAAAAQMLAEQPTLNDLLPPTGD